MPQSSCLTRSSQLNFSSFLLLAAPPAPGVTSIAQLLAPGKAPLEVPPLLSSLGTLSLPPSLLSSCSLLLATLCSRPRVPRVSSRLSTSCRQPSSPSTLLYRSSSSDELRSGNVLARSKSAWMHTCQTFNHLILSPHLLSTWSLKHHTTWPPKT